MMTEMTQRESSPRLLECSQRSDDKGCLLHESGREGFGSEKQGAVSLMCDSVSFVSSDGDHALALEKGSWVSSDDSESEADSHTLGTSQCPAPIPADVGQSALSVQRDTAEDGSAVRSTACDGSVQPTTTLRTETTECPAGSAIYPAMKKLCVRGDSDNRPHKCPQCGWAFRKASNLLSHMDTHKGLKPHVCELCGKAYSHQGTLHQHMRLHTGERPYRCPFCDRTYIWSSDYRKHIRTHTGEKPYTCTTCGKNFVRSSDLRKHERNLHTNDKPFPCLRCGKTFNKPLSLLRHERSHLGERPFRCPDCGKDFAVASRMVEHQKTHDGVRPYACSICFKTFSRPYSLGEHQAVHSGLRPFKCSECGAAFARASRLARHQRVHTGEHPFQCPACSLSFGHLTSLRRHQLMNCSERKNQGTSTPPTQHTLPRPGEEGCHPSSPEPSHLDHTNHSLALSPPTDNTPPQTCSTHCPEDSNETI